MENLILFFCGLFISALGQMFNKRQQLALCPIGFVSSQARLEIDNWSIMAYSTNTLGGGLPSSNSDRVWKSIKKHSLDTEIGRLKDRIKDEKSAETLAWLAEELAKKVKELSNL